MNTTSLLTHQSIQKYFDKILLLTGTQSFIDWSTFSKTSHQLVSSIDNIIKQLTLLKQKQLKNFLTTMRKLKGYDIPDVIKSVRQKKLPKQALKGMLGYFKIEKNQIKLLNSKQDLYEKAQEQFCRYINRNEMMNCILGLCSNEIKPYLNDVQQKKQEKQKKIDIEYIQGTKFMSIKSYEQLIKVSAELVRQQYIQLVKVSRKYQRQNIDNIQKYYECLSDYVRKYQKLILNGQISVAYNIGFTFQQLEANQQYLIKLGFASKILQIQSKIRQQLKQSLPPQNKVQASQIANIFNLFLQTIKTKSSKIKQIINLLPKNQQTKNAFSLLLSIILNDYIYIQKQLQQEDYIYLFDPKYILNNPIIKNTYQQMQNSLVKLRKEFNQLMQKKK